MESLEGWVDDGMAMFLRSVGEVEAALRDPGYDNEDGDGGSGSDYGSVNRKTEATAGSGPVSVMATPARDATAADAGEAGEAGLVPLLRGGVERASDLGPGSIPAASVNGDGEGWGLCRAVGVVLRGGGGGGGYGSYSRGGTALSSDPAATTTASSSVIPHASVSRRTASALGCSADGRRGLAAAAHGRLGVGGVRGSGGVVPAVVLLRSQPKRRRPPADDGGLAGQEAAGGAGKAARKRGLGSEKKSAGTAGSGARPRQKANAGSSSKKKVGARASGGGAEDRDAARFGKALKWLTGAVSTDEGEPGAGKRRAAAEERRSWGGWPKGRAASESTREVGVSARTNTGKRKAEKVAGGTKEGGGETRPTRVSEGSWGWWKEVAASESSGAKVGERARVSEAKVKRSKQSRGETRSADKEKGRWRRWKGATGAAEARASASEGKAKLGTKPAGGEEHKAAGKAEKKCRGGLWGSAPAKPSVQVESKSRVARGDPKLGGGPPSGLLLGDGQSAAEEDGSGGWWRRVASSDSSKRSGAEASGETTKGSTTPKRAGGKNDRVAAAGYSAVDRKEARGPKPSTDTTGSEDGSEASSKAESNNERVWVGASGAAEGDSAEGELEEGGVAGEGGDWLGPTRRWISDPFNSGDAGEEERQGKKKKKKKPFALTTASTLRENERRRSGRDPPLRIDLERSNGGGVGDESGREESAQHDGRVSRRGAESESGLLSEKGEFYAKGCSYSAGGASEASSGAPTAADKDSAVADVNVDVVEAEGGKGGSGNTRTTDESAALPATTGYSVVPSEMYARALERDEDARKRRAESVRQKRVRARARVRAGKTEGGESAAIVSGGTEMGEDATDDIPASVESPSNSGGVNNDDHDDDMLTKESTARERYEQAPPGGSERAESAAREGAGGSKAPEDGEAVVLEVGDGSEDEDEDDAAGASTADVKPSARKEGGVNGRGPNVSAFVSTAGSQYERALQRRAWRAETALLMRAGDGDGAEGGHGGWFVVGTAAEAVGTLKSRGAYLRDCVVRGVSAGCVTATTAVGEVGNGAARGVATSARACASGVGVVLSPPVYLVRKAAGFGADLVYLQEDDDATAVIAVTDGGNGTAAGGVKLAALAPSCVRLCQALAWGISAGCAKATATVGMAGGATAAAALTVGRAAARALVKTIQVCAGCAGFVASSPVLLARAVVVSGKKAVTTGSKVAAGAAAGCAGAAGRLGGRCVCLGGSVVGGVAAGCLTAKATACLVGETAGRGMSASAKWGARCAGFAVLTPAKLVRAVLFPPRGVRSSGGPDGRSRKSITPTGAAISAASGAEVVGEGGRARFEVTTTADGAQKTVANAEGTAEPAMSTKDNGSQSLNAREGPGPSSKFGSMAAGVIAKQPENAVPVDQSSLRGGRQQELDAQATATQKGRRLPTPAKSATPSAVDERQQEGHGLAEDVVDPKGSSSSPVPAAAAPSFLSPWFESARASLGLASHSDRTTAPSNDTIAATPAPALAPAAYSAVEPSRIHSPKRAAAQADAELARWVLTPPSEAVPERSGRRSRSLIGGASRAVRVASGWPATIGNSGGAGAVGGAGLTRALRAKAVGEAVGAGAARFPRKKRLRAALRLAVAGPLCLRAGR